MRSLGLLSRSPRHSVTFALTLLTFGTGLCRPARSRIIEFDPSGSYATFPIGINDSKSITGWYEDSKGNVHGFLRTPDGSITTFDVEDDGCATTPFSINRSGVIVGEEGDSNCNFHGFIRASDGTITTFDVPDATETEAQSVNNRGLITGIYHDSSD